VGYLKVLLLFTSGGIRLTGVLDEARFIATPRLFGLQEIEHAHNDGWIYGLDEDAGRTQRIDQGGRRGDYGGSDPAHSSYLGDAASLDPPKLSPASRPGEKITHNPITYRNISISYFSISG
jgi:hypothetical protein